ncbi:MAG: hypothetical protein IH602_15860 [Bryobacteraceae bacterium]|nr:hypothetical protein [Bryobacteraceae bacterium]
MDDDERIFTHALYHTVTHWAAFMVAMGLLLSMGVVLSKVSRPSGVKLWFCVSATGAILAACFYFLQRIKAFGGELEKRLPAAYLKGVWLLGQNWKWNLALGGLAAIAAALGNLFVLFG